MSRLAEPLSRVGPVLHRLRERPTPRKGGTIRIQASSLAQLAQSPIHCNKLFAEPLFLLILTQILVYATLENFGINIIAQVGMCHIFSRKNCAKKGKSSYFGQKFQNPQIIKKLIAPMNNPPHDPSVCQKANTLNKLHIFYGPSNFCQILFFKKINFCCQILGPTEAN